MNYFISGFIGAGLLAMIIGIGQGVHSNAGREACKQVAGSTDCVRVWVPLK